MYLDLCKFSFRLVKDENWPEDVAKCPLSCAELGWLDREAPEFCHFSLMESKSLEAPLKQSGF